MAKQSKNLSLDPEAVRRGERYSELHGTNVSQLVNNFLLSLPVAADVADEALTPTVRRILGVARGSRGIEEYREHLVEKYGRR
ncbi:MAG: hypothetical protein IRZ00_01275 [Gemmatimonadetes bacterium]|nr:hypothetical protein [Gemmatimonadota bacterium]